MAYDNIQTFVRVWASKCCLKTDSKLVQDNSSRITIPVSMAQINKNSTYLDIW